MEHVFNSLLTSGKYHVRVLGADSHRARYAQQPPGIGNRVQVECLKLRAEDSEIMVIRIWGRRIRIQG